MSESIRVNVVAPCLLKEALSLLVRQGMPEARTAGEGADVALLYAEGDWRGQLAALRGDGVRSSGPRVVLVMPASWPHLAEAARLGVHGFISTGETAGELQKAIGCAAAGKCYALRSVIIHLLAHSRATAYVEGLTPRERQAHELMSACGSRVAVAGQMGVSINTVKTELANARRKLRA